ncbi:MAG: RimK/LysX family protein [Spirochaetota bacterium]
MRAENYVVNNSFQRRNSLLVLGWRELISLPDLKIPAIKAKIDTGARTSCLHAFDIEPFLENGRLKVRFLICPFQKRRDRAINCCTDVTDRRAVKDSGGHWQLRYVISTTLLISGRKWLIEVALTDREEMKFRMLIGRNALKEHVIIDPSKSYVTRKT